MDGRDRDASGRARSARPRDGLGRPLPYGSQGVPTMPDDLALTVLDGVRLAQELLDAGRPFHAHEVLESLWKSTQDPDERELWQGLAQLAVGLTHAGRGNAAGARRLIARGRGRLAGLAAPRGAVHVGAVDVPGVVAWADAWLAGDRTAALRLIGPDAGEP